MKLLKNKKGVTLAELLAVITIMGIIAAIAVPAIGTAIDTANNKQSEGHAIAVYEAARVFCTIESDACKNVTTITSADTTNLGNYIDGTPGTGHWSVTIANSKPTEATVLIVGVSDPVVVADINASGAKIATFDGSLAEVSTVS